MGIKPNEESPSSIGQGCRLTAGEGDFKDSATEIDYRQKRYRWKGEVKAHRRPGDRSAV